MIVPNQDQSTNLEAPINTIYYFLPLSIIKIKQKLMFFLINNFLGYRQRI